MYSPTHHTQCLLCQSENLKPLKGYESHELVRCGQCSFCFIARIPSAQELEEFYADYHYQDPYQSPLTVQSYHRLLDTFEKYRSTNRLLDVGCGLGWFLLEARKRGWEVHGTEYAPAVVDKLRQQGITMHEGPLEGDSFQADGFDVITSFEVLEHINNPREEVAHIHRMLRTSGLFYCTTPNFNSLLRHYLRADFNVIHYPEHLTYFTRSTLRKLLRTHGFRSRGIYTHGISLTRLRGSLGNGQEKMMDEHSSDEQLRRRIASNLVLQWGKRAANLVLNATGTGMSLKGYFEKK
jgi:2-polyprenyl-3-methyl-5-hydroxy-6-metoxy-1,4-benzoquinol methylase